MAAKLQYLAEISKCFPTKVAKISVFTILKVAKISVFSTFTCTVYFFESNTMRQRRVILVTATIAKIKEFLDC